MSPSSRAISCKGLSKVYTISHQSAQRGTLGQALVDWLKNPLRGKTNESFWALRDVEFDIEIGQVVGIIGRNGAGKSTLLKILSRITLPTAGQIELFGRVGSLLEVGTGFHPELTGRENIYLNGSILGMRRKEINRQFDAIVDFSGVEKFLDTPVKRYSSGMYVRLAFAVAAHLNPEILVVDEVLAVGDAQFQAKCLGKMKDVATSGRTVLFVSHNMAAIQSLCGKALRMQAGKVAGFGDVNPQIESYLQDINRHKNETGFKPRQLTPTLSLDLLSFSPNPVASGESLTFNLELSSSGPTQATEIAILIFSQLGTRVAIIDLRSNRHEYRFDAGRPLKLRGKVCSLPFVEGDYAVGLYLNCGDMRGDVLDLTTLSVTGRLPVPEIPPYSPNDRGFMDLSYEFDLI